MLLYSNIGIMSDENPLISSVAKNNMNFVKFAKNIEQTIKVSVITK